MGMLLPGLVCLDTSVTAIQFHGPSGFRAVGGAPVAESGRKHPVLPPSPIPLR